MVREVNENELSELLELYLHLHEKSVPEMTEHLNKTWKTIIQDANHHIIVKIVDGRIVSSCVCVIIPNLTRNIRPYAFVENVVTHVDYRGKGYATECLNYAKEIAEKMDCYKMMLLTGSKRKKRLTFMRKQVTIAMTKLLLFNGLSNYSNSILQGVLNGSKNQT